MLQIEKNGKDGSACKVITSAVKCEGKDKHAKEETIVLEVDMVHDEKTRMKKCNEQHHHLASDCSRSTRSGTAVERRAQKRWSGG